MNSVLPVLAAGPRILGRRCGDPAHPRRVNCSDSRVLCSPSPWMPPDVVVVDKNDRKSPAAGASCRASPRPRHTDAVYACSNAEGRERPTAKIANARSRQWGWPIARRSGRGRIVGCAYFTSYPPLHLIAHRRDLPHGPGTACVQVAHSSASTHITTGHCVQEGLPETKLPYAKSVTATEWPFDNIRCGRDVIEPVRRPPQPAGGTVGGQKL
jgi:hypothetical protein